MITSHLQVNSMTSTDKTKTFKEPYGPHAWLTQQWAAIYEARYNMPCEYGPKPTKIVKSLWAKLEEVFPQDTPKDVYDRATHMANLFIDRDEFDWIDLRDLPAFNGNIYRVQELINNESDEQENSILTELFALEARLLPQTEKQIQGGDEVSEIAASGRSGEVHDRPLQIIHND